MVLATGRLRSFSYIKGMQRGQSGCKPTIVVHCVAERQGFEPWIPCGIHAFQACAFSHSAISPLRLRGRNRVTCCSSFAQVFERLAEM